VEVRVKLFLIIYGVVLAVLVAGFVLQAYQQGWL
jgi:hypothetical protein